MNGEKAGHFNHRCSKERRSAGPRVVSLQELDHVKFFKNWEYLFRGDGSL